MCVKENTLKIPRDTVPSYALRFEFAAVHANHSLLLVKSANNSKMLQIPLELT